MSALSALQFSLNNSVHVVIEKFLNQVVIDFQFREIMIAVIMSSALRQSSNTVTTDAKSEFEKNRFVFQKKIDDVTAFVVAKSKILYDKRHQFLKLNLGDKAYFRFHHEYFLSSQINVKLFNQRIESFLVKRRIDKLAYELNLSSR